MGQNHVVEEMENFYLPLTDYEFVSGGSEHADHVRAV